MPYFSEETEIYIDVDDFLNSIDDEERKELIQSLVDDGYIKPQSIPKPKNILDLEWDEVIEKLSSGRLNLSKSDEDIIKKIANKL